MSETTTRRKLKNKYGKVFGHYAIGVLINSGHLGPKTASGHEILKPLPTEEEIRFLVNKQHTTTVGDLISDAFGVFEELAGEMDDWYSNMPESLQCGDKASTIQETASTLQNLSEPDVPQNIADIEVVFIPSVDCNSRSDRRDEAVLMLQNVVDEISSLTFDETETEEKKEGEEKKEEAEEVDADQIEECDVDDLTSSLEEAIGEAEGVEFPLMYG